MGFITEKQLEHELEGYLAEMAEEENSEAGEVDDADEE